MSTQCTPGQMEFQGLGRREVIGKFDGYVAKFMGDGVLAYFGYPLAHEDDAERALHI